MKSKILILIYFPAILFFSGLHSFAQKHTNRPDNFNADSVLKIHSLNNEADSLQHWKHKREFAYMNYIDSLLRKKTAIRSDTMGIGRSKGKIKRPTKKLKDHSAINKILNSYPLQIFLWIAAISFIGFIVYKLFFKDLLFDKKEKVDSEKQMDDLISSLDDFSKSELLINDAEAKKNYNLATRYLFLQMLKNMADEEIINFSPEKTNLDYLNEIPSKDKRQFSFLIRNYEYVWYGKFSIDKIKYLELKEKFISFNSKLKAG